MRNSVKFRPKNGDGEDGEGGGGEGEGGGGEGEGEGDTRHTAPKLPKQGISFQPPFEVKPTPS